MKHHLAACLCGLMAVPGLAATVGEEDKIRIERLNATDFEVVSGSFVGGAEYFWCGAATYVLRRTGRSGLTEIYIKRPIAPRSDGRKSVIFTTSDVGVPSSGAQRTLTLDRAGAMLKANRARSYCRDAFTRSTK